MAKEDKLKMKFKLNGLEFELEGKEATVKEEFENFKSFLTGDILPNINSAPVVIANQEHNLPKQIATEKVYAEAEDVQTEEYPIMKEVVKKDLPKSESDWIMTYGFYASNYGEETFSEDDIKNGYDSTTRKTDSRMKNLSNNLKTLFGKSYIKYHNDTEMRFTDDGLVYIKKLVLGKSNRKSKKPTSSSTKVKKENTKKTSSSKSSSGAPWLFKLDRNLNLRPGDKTHLSDFFDNYEANKTPERVLLVVYYLEEVLEIEKINLNHIYTAFDKLDIRIPKSLYQLISDSKNKFGYLDFESTDDMKVSVSGKNVVNFDLKK